MKFITDSNEFDPASLKEATPYTVMFGADKCGSTNKVSLTTLQVPVHQLIQ